MSEISDNDLEPAKPTNKAPIVVAVVSAICVLGMGATMMMKPAHSSTPSSDGKSASAVHGPEMGPTVKPQDFVVRLRNPEVDRYARLGLEIEVGNAREKDALQEHMPQIRDAVISYLSDRTMEDLRGSEGLAQLKDALRKNIASVVPFVTVRGVYITDFVSQ